MGVSQSTFGITCFEDNEDDRLTRAILEKLAPENRWIHYINLTNSADISDKISKDLVETKDAGFTLMLLMKSSCSIIRELVSLISEDEIHFASIQVIYVQNEKTDILGDLKDLHQVCDEYNTSLTMGKYVPKIPVYTLDDCNKGCEKNKKENFANCLALINTLARKDPPKYHSLLNAENFKDITDNLWSFDSGADPIKKICENQNKLKMVSLFLPLILEGHLSHVVVDTGDFVMKEFHLLEKDVKLACDAVKKYIGN